MAPQQLASTLTVMDDVPKPVYNEKLGTYLLAFPGRDLHRRAMIVARRKGLNLNAVVSEALRRYLDREDQVA